MDGLLWILVAGIDRILDMGLTVVNITGDSVCAVCVDHWETKREERMGAMTQKGA